MPLDATSNSKSTFLLLTLLAAYFILGLMVHSDYGVSWDEPISRHNGKVNVKYIGEKFAPFLLTQEIQEAPDLHDWTDKDYGVAFETPLVIFEYLLDLKDSKEIYLFRHLATFIVSFLGVLAVFAISNRIYKDSRFAMLAALMLIFSPRIFAESFYNSKDIVFMALIAMAIYSMTVFLTNPSLHRAVFHGFVSALAIDVRIMGLVMVLCTLGALVAQAFKHEVAPGKTLLLGITYIATCCAFVFVMFPFLWDDPLGNFAFALSNMSNFRWPGSVLYMGDFIPADELPWHYIPVWILITTPPLFSLLMGIGVAQTIRQLFLSKTFPWANEKEMLELIVLSLLIGPILAVIMLSSVLYDGWRQMYFVYPAFVLMAVKGAVTAFGLVEKHLKMKAIAIWLLVLCFAYTASWMLVSHPLQNVYFNFLAGSDLKNRFELDYWGLANKDAIQFIVDNEQTPLILIQADSYTFLDRALLTLDRKDRERVQIVTGEPTPPYLLTNYRYVEDKDDSKYAGNYSLVYQKIVSGEAIVSVFRRRDLEEASY